MMSDSNKLKEGGALSWDRVLGWCGARWGARMGWGAISVPHTPVAAPEREVCEAQNYGQNYLQNTEGMRLEVVASNTSLKGRNLVKMMEKVPEQGERRRRRIRPKHVLR